jgi:hypothetical protein
MCSKVGIQYGAFQQMSASILELHIAWVVWLTLDYLLFTRTNKDLKGQAWAMIFTQWCFAKTKKKKELKKIELFGIRSLHAIYDNLLEEVSSKL